MTKIFLSSLVVFLAISLKPVVVHADDDEGSVATDSVATDNAAPDNSANENAPADKVAAIDSSDDGEPVPPPTEWEQSKQARENAANSYMDEEMNRKSFYDPVPAPEMHGDINSPSDVSGGSTDSYNESAPAKHHAKKHKVAMARHVHKKSKKHASKVAAHSKKHGKQHKTAKSRSHRYAKN